MRCLEARILPSSIWLARWGAIEDGGRHSPPLYAKEVSIIEPNCRTGWRQCQCPPWPRDPLLSFLKAVSVTRRMTMVSTAPPWCSHSPSCPPLVPLASRDNLPETDPEGSSSSRPLGPLPPLSYHPFNCFKLPQHPTIIPRAWTWTWAWTWIWPPLSYHTFNCCNTPQSPLGPPPPATRYQSGGFFSVSRLLPLEYSVEAADPPWEMCIDSRWSAPALDNHSALHGTMLTKSSNHHRRRNRFR